MNEMERNKAYQPRTRRAADALDALRHVSGKTILTPADVRALEAAQAKRDRKAGARLVREMNTRNTIEPKLVSLP